MDANLKGGESTVYGFSVTKKARVQLSFSPKKEGTDLRAEASKTSTFVPYKWKEVTEIQLDRQLTQGFKLMGMLVGMNGSTRFECACGISTRDPRVNLATRVIACRTCSGAQALELLPFLTDQARAFEATKRALATLRTYRTHARWTHCESFALEEASQLVEQGNFVAALRVAEDGVAELYRKVGRTSERRNGRPHRR